MFPPRLLHGGLHEPRGLRQYAEYTEIWGKHSVEAVDEYMELHDSLDGFEERYCGEWDSEEDFARHIVESCYDL